MNLEHVVRAVSCARGDASLESLNLLVMGDLPSGRERERGYAAINSDGAEIEEVVLHKVTHLA